MEEREEREEKRRRRRERREGKERKTKKRGRKSENKRVTRIEFQVYYAVFPLSTRVAVMHIMYVCRQNPHTTYKVYPLCIA